MIAYKRHSRFHILFFTLALVLVLGGMISVFALSHGTKAHAASVTITDFPISTGDSLPHGITSGPDGNLWFTETAGNKIGRITPSGSFTEYPIPTSISGSFDITSGPDGNLWFTEKDGNKIGRATPNGNSPGRY